MATKEKENTYRYILMDFVKHITRMSKNIIRMTNIPTLMTLTGSTFGRTMTSALNECVMLMLIGRIFFTTKLIDADAVGASMDVSVMSIGVKRHSKPFWVATPQRGNKQTHLISYTHTYIHTYIHTHPTGGGE